MTLDVYQKAAMLLEENSATSAFDALREAAEQRSQTCHDPNLREFWRKTKADLSRIVKRAEKL